MPKNAECSHDNVKQDGRFFVCQDCGEVLDDEMAFAKNVSVSGTYYDSDSQRDYERKIKISDSMAKKDPRIKQKYDKIQTLNKWYADYKSSFTEQKKTLDLLKSYGIGLNIDKVMYKHIKNS